LAGFSDDLELKLLDHVFGGGDYTRLATVYIALFTAAPNDAGGGTECNYTGYVRKAVTNNATNFPAAAAGAKSNGVAITFDPCTAGSNSATHFAIMSLSTGGVQLGWGALGAALAISAGITPEFAIGDLDITLD
jgi:hypothetical protein